MPARHDDPALAPHDHPEFGRDRLREGERSRLVLASLADLLLRNLPKFPQIGLFIKSFEACHICRNLEVLGRGPPGTRLHHPTAATSRQITDLRGQTPN